MGNFVFQAKRVRIQVADVVLAAEVVAECVVQVTQEADLRFLADAQPQLDAQLRVVAHQCVAMIVTVEVASQSLSQVVARLLVTVRSNRSAAAKSPKNSRLQKKLPVGGASFLRRLGFRRWFLAGAKGGNDGWGGGDNNDRTNDRNHELVDVLYAASEVVANEQYATNPRQAAKYVVGCE